MLTHYIEVRFDRLPTTALGSYIYTATPEEITARLLEPIDWETESIHPLHAALLALRDDIALELLALGSPLDDHALYLAYRFGARKTFAHMAAKLPNNTKIRPEEADSLLLDIARAKDMDTLTKMIPLFPNIDATDYFYGFPGWTALHHASYHCQPDMVSLLLSAGATPNLQNADGKTCLALTYHVDRHILRRERATVVCALRNHGAVAPELSAIQNFFLTYGLVV